MQNHNSLKKEFYKKWITSLQICSSSKENMNLLERKKAIKLSADLAMASTRNGKRTWSCTFISESIKDSETGTLAKKILGDKTTKCLSQDYLNATTTTTTTTTITTKHKSRTIFVRSNNNNKSTTPKKICKFRKHGPKKCGASNSCKVRARSMAKRLVMKRRQILKGLIPGGEYMDEYSLVKETLDYVVSLRAQVDVMQYLANSPQLFIHNY